MTATTETQSAPKFRVKFHGGPLHGHTKDYPGEQGTFTVFGWQYESTGRREQDYWVYVLMPSNRRKRKLVQWMMAMTGMDPRLAERKEPIRVPQRGRNEKCYCGSGRKFKHCHLEA